MTYRLPNYPVVYRVYDKTDRLIYVGASRSVVDRMVVHKANTWWFELVARVEFDPHPTMEAAFAAESVAIQEMQPAFNVRDNPGGPFMTVADAKLARRWHQQPGHYFPSFQWHDRINRVLDLEASRAA